MCKSCGILLAACKDALLVAKSVPRVPTVIDMKPTIRRLEEALALVENDPLTGRKRNFINPYEVEREDDRSGDSGEGRLEGDTG